MLFSPPIVSIRGNFPGRRKFGRRLAPSGTRRGVTFVIRGGVSTEQEVHNTKIQRGEKKTQLRNSSVRVEMFTNVTL